MDVIYSENYNFDLGVLANLHPFEGLKFGKIHEALKDHPQVRFIEPEGPMSMDAIDQFLTDDMRQRVRDKDSVFDALEVPRLPFVSYAFLEERILTPKRWGVAGTMLGASMVLDSGGTVWNLSGGYHHAMPQNMEGFCIYNDIGICHQQFIANGLLAPDDRILIVDTDAHHGNGNARTFMENRQVTLLDVYNELIYPIDEHTRERVDIPVPLAVGTEGETYLQQFEEALDLLEDDYRLAFVVAGTDTIHSDMLGCLKLTIDDVAEREKTTHNALEKRGVPTVLTGAGGYSQDCAAAVTRAISVCVEAGLGRSVAR